MRSSPSPTPWASAYATQTMKASPPRIVTLLGASPRHSSKRAGQPAAYILAGSTVQELNWYKQSGSWFAGDSVVEGMHHLMLYSLPYVALACA